jgi:hypothetical protein
MKESKTVLAHTPTPGRRGVRVDRAKYEIIRDAIVSVLSARREVAFRDLPEAVGERLRQPFDGSIPWYTTTVKLDMEVRSVIERIPGSKPQRLRLKRA